MCLAGKTLFIFNINIYSYISFSVSVMLIILHIVETMQLMVVHYNVLIFTALQFESLGSVRFVNVVERSFLCFTKAESIGQKSNNYNLK